MGSEQIRGYVFRVIVPGGTNALANLFRRNIYAAEQIRYDTGYIASQGLRLVPRLEGFKAPRVTDNTVRCSPVPALSLAE